MIHPGEDSRGSYRHRMVQSECVGTCARLSDRSGYLDRDCFVSMIVLVPSGMDECPPRGETKNSACNRGGFVVW
jgi:hypothetical protein